MVAPSYTEDLNDITLAESTSDGGTWVAIGGGNISLGAGSDFSMQGNNAVDSKISNVNKGPGVPVTSFSPGTNDHVFTWIFQSTPGLTATLANEGVAVVIGTTSANFVKFHVEGSDTYGAEGRVGICYPVRYVTSGSASPPYRTVTGSPGATPSFVGATTSISGLVKGSNFAVDAVRYGTGAYITAGESGDPATFAGFATDNDNVDNRWGILTAVGGGYELQGRFVVGQDNAGTPTLAYFSDSNRVISFVDTPHTLTDFTQIIIDHESTVFNITNCTFQALGTNNPGRLVFNNAATVSALTTCTFSKMGISTLRGAVIADGCTWRGCGQITANSATITNSTIANYTGATNTSALVWDTNLDPDGYLDGTTFTKGTTGTTHAIEFGTTSPTSMTLTDVNFSGYNASNNQDDSAIHIKRDSGTVTINIAGGNSPSYRSDGADVAIVSDTVNVTLTAQTAAGSPIGSAAVFIKASGVSGPFPVGETVTIANSGTTATVTHTDHGLTVNDKVYIDGIGFDDVYSPNWGVFTITSTPDVDTYTYTMTSAPGSSPTGGTSITSTFVILSGTTNGSGQITMSRVFDNDQPFTGWIRKSTDPGPFYKEGLVSGTVSSSTGASPVALMVLDE